MTPEQLKQWQTMHGLTVVQMTRIFRKSPSQIHKWFAGTHKIPGMVQGYAEALTTVWNMFPEQKEKIKWQSQRKIGGNDGM